MKGAASWYIDCKWYGVFLCKLGVGRSYISVSYIVRLYASGIDKNFARWGITHTYVEGNDVSVWEKAIRSNPRMLFFETPSNPSLELLDVEAITKLGKSKDLIVNFNNCFVTSYLQNPANMRLILLHTLPLNLLRVRVEYWGSCAYF